jgi:hypothetical protein
MHAAAEAGKSGMRGSSKKTIFSGMPISAMFIAITVG